MDIFLFEHSFAFTFELIPSIYQFQSKESPGRLIQTNCQYLKDFILSLAQAIEQAKPNLWILDSDGEFDKIYQWRVEFYESRQFQCQENPV